MNITIVTTTFNDQVHGTFNDKRTGCGINMLKPENATRFRRGGQMTDLGEITCERCKTKIAKEMIRSDQKEMKAILKEERLRAKKGIDDIGIVPLGNTTAKITAPQTNTPPAPAPVPVPTPAVAPTEPPKPAYQPNGAPALNDDLAQFAINKPVAEEPAPQNDFIEDYSAPVEPAPQPETAPIDDFLAQFAINKPAENIEEKEENEEADFLAQFAVSNETTQPEQPAAPPVIDDVSAALAAMEQNAYIPNQPVQQTSAPVLDEVPEPAPMPAPVQQPTDIIPTAPVQSASEPVTDEPEEDLNNFGNDWDILANSLFAGSDLQAENEVKAPVLDDIGGNSYPAPEPVVAEPVKPAPEPVIPEPVKPVPEPVIPEPVQIQPEPVHTAPVIDDIAEALSALNMPTVPDVSIDDDPIFEHLADDDELEFIDPAFEPEPVINEPKTPVLNDISDALSALNAQPAPAPVKPVAPVQPAPAPVQNAAPAQPAPVPVQNAAPAPVQNVAPVQPTPAPVQNVAPAQPAGAVGQVISVPQLTGYDAANQPIYTYIQMQIQGYDQNGQPVLVPLPGQNIPIPTASASTFSQRYKDSRLRDAIAAAKEIPTSTKDMTPGQKIAAANAAKGDPVSANVSKIATNPHTKNTSQAFISAISVSKEYANQSLTETQGLQQRTSVLNSVEDVLSQLGDNSLKEKKAAEKKAQMNVPVYQEYKAPVRNTYSSPRPSAPPAPKPAPVDDRTLTKAELKAKKKQEKIDAKFQKEMMKRK